MTPLELHCKFCNRYLGMANDTLIAVIKCSNSKCKKDNQIKVVNSKSTDEQLRYKFKEIVNESN